MSDDNRDESAANERSKRALTTRMEIEADQLTRSVIGAAIEIHTAMGKAHAESAYRKALVQVLRKDGFQVEQERSLDIEVRGCVVATSSVDLWIEEELVVELKAVGRLTDVHMSQLGRYVMAAGIRRGLLINFGEARLRTQRFTNFDADLPRSILRNVERE